MVKTETFRTEDLNGEYIDLNEVSFAEDPYNQTSIYTKFEVNATRYNVLNLKINGTQAIDYYKMILRANNTGSYSTMVISPNNPWLDDSGMNTWPYVGGNIDGSGTGNFNGTTEFFSAMREFYISIHIDSEIDSNYDTEFYVELHNSNIPILTVGDLSEVKGGLNMTLVLGLSLGIGIPVLLGAGYWFWKKR